MTTHEPKTIRQMNAAWRADMQPGAAIAAAMHDVIREGELDVGARDALVDDLYDAMPDRARGDSSRVLVERVYDGVRVRIEADYWRLQPLGVICQPVHHRVNGEGSAVLADCFPRSDEVAADVFPTEHVALRVVPTPVWLARFFGEDGFPTLEDAE